MKCGPKNIQANPARSFWASFSQNNPAFSLHQRNLNLPKMTRGEVSLSKVHYKGKFDDYILFVSDVEAYKKWLNDKSVPLARFVSPLAVFVTHK